MFKITALWITLFSLFGANASYGQLFKKKQKENNSDLLVFRDDQKESELRGNGVDYFIGNILPTNDTNRIKEVMKSRNYSFNMLLGDPITGYDNFYTHERCNSLLVVIESCDYKTLKFFLDNGANPNLRVIHKVPNRFTGEIQGVYYSIYPLEAAALIYDTAKINLLIKYGANKTVVESSLKKLAFANQPDSKIDNKIFVAYITNLYGGTVPKDAILQLILNSSNKITPQLISDYVKNGADINITDGRTGNFGESIARPLLLIAIQNKLSLDNIKEIIQQGANVNNASPRTGFAYAGTPLMTAICQNNFELVKFLVEKGANINTVGGCGRNEGTPLSIARNQGFNKIADYLFEKGAN